jgi:hypothetical protein
VNTESKEGLKMEKFLVDKHEVLKVIVDTYDDLYRNEEMVTDEEISVINFAKRIIDRINTLDAQKIEGIDFTYGGRIPQEVVEHCQFKETEN